MTWLGSGLGRPSNLLIISFCFFNILSTYLLRSLKKTYLLRETGNSNARQNSLFVLVMQHKTTS